ncbi:MAG: amidase family protein [Myxococcota bacterium]|nr:amidase family protein [Myxococcota bacterium]
MADRLPEYDEWDGLDMAARVASGDVSALDLVEAAIERIEAYNPQLNAVVHRQYERARQHARGQSHQSPFAGVPFLLKDLLGEDAGQPSTCSNAALAQWRAAHDSELVRRFKDAGLNIVGRTNTPELGIYGVTESKFRGPAYNPWHLEHSPGGSSGGAGAAVGARIVPIAHGGDGGGSIRIPASHNGVFGLKPTRGRLPAGPDRGERWHGFVCEGVLTRSVRDTAACLDAIAGPDVGAPYFAMPPEQPYLLSMNTPPRPLKIALTEDALFGHDTHADNLAAVRHTGKLLESLGHTVDYARPQFDRDKLVKAYLVVVSAGVSMGLMQIEDKIGRTLKASEAELPTWAMKLIADSINAGEYMYYVNTIQREARRVAAFFEDWDMLLTPTAAAPPARVGQFALTAAQKTQVKVLRRLPIKKVLEFALDQMAKDALDATPNTMLFNQTGQPAMSVPLYWNDDDLPIGTQLVGRYGDETTLLQVARQLEEAQPWNTRRPGLIDRTTGSAYE